MASVKFWILTMKTLICLLFVEYLLVVQSEEFDRKLLCESCIAVATEIEKTLQDAPTMSQLAVIKKLLRGEVCDKLPQDKRSFCRHLLGINRDEFTEALSDNKDHKQLDIVLCYEQSTTCVGIKLQTFKDHATSFESDLDALLRENKDKVRFAKPAYSSATVQPKEEL